MKKLRYLYCKSEVFASKDGFDLERRFVWPEIFTPTSTVAWMGIELLVKMLVST